MSTHLCTGIGTGKEDTRGSAGERSSLARLAEVAQSRDDALNAPLLPEAGLHRGQQGCNDGNLGVHGGMAKAARVVPENKRVEEETKNENRPSGYR